MFNSNYITKEDMKEHNPKWPEIPDHPYRILIIGGPGSGKTNALRSLIHHEPDTDKIYLYAKHPSEAKYQLLINEREITGLKYLNDSKAFIECSYDMGDIYKIIEEYNPDKKPKIFFFLSGFSFTDTDDSEDSRGREGTIFYSTLLLPPAHEHSDIYLSLCM